MEWIIAAFILKHFVCDFPLQVPSMYLNKGKYGHPGGLLHAAIHGIGTWIVLLAFGFPPVGGLALSLLDFGVHYHVDWAKNQINDRFRLFPSNKYFWWLLGVDQLCHYLTYVYIASVAFA